MKKLLFSIALFLFPPALIFAQPLDFTTVYSENFDGPSPSVTFETVNGGRQWATTSQLSVSPPNSIFTKIEASGNSTSTFYTTAIEVQPNHNYIYLDFDHICKMVNLVHSTITIQHSNDGVNWRGNDDVDLTFNQNSPYYYGTATSITNNSFNESSYAAWGGTNPAQSWWRSEKFDINQFINKNYTYYRIGFRMYNEAGLPFASPGWFIDNVKVVSSLTELFPPTITFQPPHIDNSYPANITNNIGPYTIKALLSDNDTIAVNTIDFKYDVNGGPAQTVQGNIISNVFSGGRNNVTVEWIIPAQCYGDTIRYRINVKDTHGSEAITAVRTFTPRSGMANIGTNDADLVDYYGFPWALVTGQSQDVSIRFQNKSMNHMQELTLKWTANGVDKGPVTWTGDMCMDYIDSLPRFGNFIPQRGWNTVKTWIQTRNSNTPNGYLTRDTLEYRIYACDSILQGNYTLGSGGNFTTLQELKEQLYFCGLSGPVVINVLPGLYSNFTFIDTIYDNHNSTNTITFQSSTGNPDDVIIADNSNDANYGALTITNTGYFIFRNLTFRGKMAANANNSRGVYFNGRSSTHITIDNCKIITLEMLSGNDNKFAGISRTASATPPDNNLKFTNNTITGGNYGIYYLGNNNNKNEISEIVGNTVNSSLTGIYLSNNKVIDISGNTISQIPNSAQLFTGLHLERLENLATVTKNRIKTNDKGLYGIYFTTTSGTSDANRILVANNEINNKLSANNQLGIEVQSSNFLNFIHNSVRVYSTDILGKTAAFNIRSGNTIHVENNIFVNECRSGGNTNYPIYLETLPNNFTANYNDYYSVGENVGYYTSGLTSIEAWSNALSGRDSNSVSILPDFINTSVDLNINSYEGLESPPNSLVTDDIIGRPRTGLTYMGAYSAIVPSTNLAVNRMVSPPQLFNCPQPSYPIVIEIMNAGSGTINFSASNKATIQASVRGGLVFDTIVEVTSGSLAPLETREITISSRKALPYNTPVHFSFTLNMPNDTVRRNDTLRINNYLLELISLDNSLGQNEYEEVFSNNPLVPSWKFEQVSGVGNWRVQPGTGADPVISPVYGTGRLFFNSKNFANRPVALAIMPTISLVGSVNPTLELWFAHDNGGITAARTTEGIVVQVSTDGGATYTPLLHENATGTNALITRYKAGTQYNTPKWEKYTFHLNNYDTESCVIIAIEGRGYGGNNLNIDRILLKNVLSNDIAVTDLYILGQMPTQQHMSTKIKAKIANVGANAQSNVTATLTISGANTYTETINNINLAYQGERTLIFNGTQLSNPGQNTVTVSVNPDQNNANNSQARLMVTTLNQVAHADDTTSSILAIGGTTAHTKLVNRYNVEEEIMVKAVRFYPVSDLDAPGKQVIAFVSDLSGVIRATSDTLTITEEMVNTWIEVPLNNYALTNVSDCFFAGIQLVQPGQYIGAQVEAPIRDSSFYYLNGTVYTPQTSGKTMIGAIVDQAVVHDLAILALISPATNCDLGHEDIIVRVTNNGTSTIPAGTVFHYTINGSHLATKTFNDTLGRGETKVFAFEAPFNFTNNIVGFDSSYTVRVWVDRVTGDRISFNDTLENTIISLGKSNLPIVNSPVFVNYYTEANLTAQYPSTITDGVLSWFSSTGFESWELLHQSDVFTTPTIFYDTTFYVSVAPGRLDTSIVGTSSTNSTQPFIFNNNYSRGRILYTEEELGTRAPLSKISLFVNQAPNNDNGIPVKLYIKHTSLTALPNNVTLNWEDEIRDAQLIYDGNMKVESTGWFDFQFPELFDYQGGNILILTETNCGGACGGAPTFRASSKTAFTQSASAATPITSARLTNSSNRLNMRFIFADMSCASEKVPIEVKVTNRPNYDVQTVEFLHPTQGCTLENEHVQVLLQNMLNVPIPAGKVVVSADFNGSVIKDTLKSPLGALADTIFTFTPTFDFSARSPGGNITWNYTVWTDLNGEANVYRTNDTITGSFIAYQTDWFPDVIDTMGTFTQPFTIKLDDAHTRSFFYDSPDATTPVPNGNRVPSYTTGPLFNSVTYWVSAMSLSGSPICTTKRVQYNIHIIVPDHDLETVELVSPKDFECGLMDENLSVKVYNTKDDTIPANTFKITANFTGTATRSVDHTINQSINAHTTVDIPFTNSVTLGSNTINHIYNYTIFTDPVNPGMTVYRGNDTIKGILKVPATPLIPSPINQSVAYGRPHTFTPAAAPLNYFYLYSQATGGDLLDQGTSLTSPENYLATNTYYYSGHINDPQFANHIISGSGNVTNTATFTFTSARSNGIILYTAEEMGGYEGTIDTIAIQVSQSSVGEIPVKFYILNDSRTSITTGSHDWNTLANNALLIFDDQTDFHTSDGWFKIAIPGGFNYTGQSILILTDHDCNGQTCGNMGVAPLPSFRSTTTASRSVSRNSATGNFTALNSRINTRFSINYTCESPRQEVKFNTTVPTCDLEVTDIITPVTPDNNYGPNTNVQITIKNHGTASATGFTVGYYLEGEPHVTENYTNTIPATTGSANYTFQAPIDLSDIYMPTRFFVYVSQTCDNYSHNDTLMIILRKPDPCTSRATDQNGADISNFTFAGINNGPGSPIFNYSYAPNDGRYTDYTQNVAPAMVVQDQSYPFSITNSFTSGSGTALYKFIYIDLNRDNQFTSDELLFSSGSVPAPTPANPSSATTTGSVYIPATATPGPTRLRVITANSNVGPCSTYTQGETEDYAVVISRPYNIDLGILSIIHPSGNVCADSRGKIKVNVKNFGLDPQILSNSNPLTVKADVTHGIITNQYSKQITNMAFAAGEVRMVTLDNVDFSSAGTYDVKVWIEYAPDQYDINDSAKSTGTVTTTTVYPTPVTEEFQTLPNGTTFSPFWIPNTNNNNFYWAVYEGRTPNFPDAGPEHDREGAPIGGLPEGKFAAVAPSATVNTSAVATLTTGCVDLHYEYNFPKRISYWEHIFSSQASSRVKLYVQVGSGDHFITVDSVTNRTQTSSGQAWKQRNTVLNDFDETAQVRFLVTGHSQKIDVAIDGINIDNGYPDIGIDEILFPLPFSEDRDNCLLLNDTIHMKVRIKNYGYTPVYGFDVIGVTSVGQYSDSVREHISGLLLPGATMDYTFIQHLTTPSIYQHCEFRATTVLDRDENERNNQKYIISCTNVGTDDFDNKNGVMLGQNIPNPAQTQTRIPFTLPQAGMATFNIYSLEGQLVHSQTAQFEAGEHSIELKTGHLADGMYFYTLQFDKVTITKKMIIQK